MASMCSISERACAALPLRAAPIDRAQYVIDPSPLVASAFESKPPLPPSGASRVHSAREMPPAHTSEDRIPCHTCLSSAAWLSLPQSPSARPPRARSACRRTPDNPWRGTGALRRHMHLGGLARRRNQADSIECRPATTEPRKNMRRMCSACGATGAICAYRRAAGNPSCASCGLS